MAKVSVIIPSYNHGAFIGEAIDSVLSQSESDLELIVIDDGSQDNSLEVIDSFSDPRLSVLTQANQGGAYRNQPRTSEGSRLFCGNS